MARVRRSPLDNRSNRLKLAIRPDPYSVTLAEGQYLRYRRPANGAAGSWLARFRDKASGRFLQVRLGTADDYQDADGVLVLSYAQAQAKAREWFATAHEQATGERVRRGPFTVREAWLAYLEDAKRRDMKSLDRLVPLVEAHILPALGEVQVEKLALAMVEKWHAAVAATPARVRTRKGSEPAYRHTPKPEEGKKAPKAPPMTADEKRARKCSANGVLTYLKAILNHAKARRLTHAEGGAWREAKTFRGVTAARIRFLAPEEVRRLVNACPPGFRELVQGAIHTGARYGELTRLEVRDFNATAGTVFIAESKSGKSRHVTLNDEGQAFFQAHCAGRPATGPIFQREGFQTRNRYGEKVVRGWRKSEQFRLMQAACETAKVEELTFHELRHTYASALVNAGVPLAYVAAQLGHGDTRMVEKHYGHLAPSDLARSIRELAPKWGLEAPKVEPLRIAGARG